MKPKYLIYLPSIGIGLFFLLYWYASTLYPGGSQASETAEGFDWLHNYWCDMMGTVAQNGSTNPAFPYAMAATIILAFSIAMFSYYFPKYIPSSPFWDQAISITGMIAMFLAVWIFSPLHDIVIIISSLFGLITIIGIYKGLHKNQLTRHIWAAWICFGLLLINNILYYGNFLYHLPLIQKITFAVVLLWLVFLNLEFRKILNLRKSKTENDRSIFIS